MRIERAVGSPSLPEHTVIAIGPSTASTMSARLISSAGRASVNPPPAPRTLVSRPAAGKLAHQFLRGRQGHSGLLRQLGRAQARARFAASGGGHHYDRIIGKVGQAHI